MGGHAFQARRALNLAALTARLKPCPPTNVPIPAFSAAGEVVPFPRMCSDRSFSAKQLNDFPRARSAERFPSVSSTPRSTAQFISSFRQILPEPLKHCVGFPFDDLSFYFLEREMNNVVMM